MDDADPVDEGDSGVYTQTPNAYVSGVPSNTNANNVGTASSDSLVAALGGLSKVAATAFGTTATSTNPLGPYQSYILIGGGALALIALIAIASR
jgi:hypothetical protein